MKGKHPDYFEAILQLRDVSPEIIDFVDADLLRTGLIITKKVELKNGFDFYCSDNEQTRALGKKLQEKYGGDYKVTATLHCRKDNKELYRVTVLFREAHFRKNDNVEYQGEIYVIKIMIKDIFLQHQKTGKKIHVKFKDMDQIKKI